MTLEQFHRLVNDRKYIEKAIERIRRKVIAARERACRLGSPITSEGHGVGSPSDPVGAAVQEISYYEQMLADYEGKLSRKQTEIEDVFAEINDQRVKLALQYKYVDGWTWFRIALTLGNNLTGDGVRMMCARYLEKNL